MGVVFDGTDEAGGRVAIKRVQLRGHSEAEIRQRNREIEIADDLIAGRAAGISVDHLLLPLDRGLDGDDLLIVMPRAEESLNAVMNRGGIDPNNAIETVSQVVRGLVQLAELSILHRDLKPANVLWHEGRWNLADFGIARNSSEPTGTYTFTGAGTAPYMAPELWQLKPASVKSDLYALGVLAYEVFTGGRPFNGPDVDDYMRQHLNDNPSPPSSLEPPLQRILLRLLRKDPNGRYQDARSVLEALENLRSRLDADQQALATAALGAEQRRSIADSREQERRHATEVIEALRSQARADLEEILHETAERAAIALPEVRLREDGLQWHLIWEDARLTVTPFSRSIDLGPGDPMILAWSLYAPAPTGLRQPIANIVCENRPGGLIFFLLQFTASGLVGNNYNFGPIDRPHGFSEQTFAQERVYMVNRALHVWQMQTESFTSAVLMRLFAEEVEASGGYE
jgi:hypothetical protein